MKRVLIFSAMTALVVGFGGGLMKSHPVVAETGNVSTQSNSMQQEKMKLPVLIMPQPGEVSEANLNFKMKTATTGLPSQMPVYKFTKVNVTDRDVAEQSKKLGMSGDVKENKIIKALWTQDGYKSLEIEKDTGMMTYRNQEHYDLKEINGRPKMVPTDEEAVRYSTEFLNKMNWLPNNFKVSGVTENREIPGNLNPDTAKGHVLSKSVHFYQYLDNKPLAGVSRIVVDVGDQGEIEVVRKYHKQHTEFAKYPAKSVDVAIAELKSHRGIHNVENGGQNPVIENVDVIYWEDAGSIEDQPYLQPVYVFKGHYAKNGSQLPFAAYIPAIANEYVVQSGK